MTFQPVEKALTASGSIAILRGNLAPIGAVLKPSGARLHLMKHRGKAVVFEGIKDCKARVADDDLDIDEISVMVLKNCGPLAIVQTGDFIALDVEGRTLYLNISDAEVKSRLKAWKPSAPAPKGGHAQIFHEKVMGADTGADFDFFVGCRGNSVAKESH